MLVLVLAVLMVSYASSMRAYLQQRDHLSSLRSDIKESRANIAQLEREKHRWSDPAYVRAQARERFGWVQPGEIGLQVIGKDGKPMGSDTSLSDGKIGTGTHEPEWYQTAWGTMVSAGLPEQKQQVPKPATTIRAPKISKR